MKQKETARKDNKERNEKEGEETKNKIFKRANQANFMKTRIKET